MPEGLAAAMFRVGGDDLRAAMVKAALLTMPKAPSLSTSRATTPRLPNHTAATPQTDTTRPEAVAPQKNIVPPAI